MTVLFFYTSIYRFTLVNMENGVQLLLTLNEHICFITLICLKHFSKPRKDRYIFLLNVYFGKIKNEHGNVHFHNFCVQIFQTM